MTASWCQSDVLGELGELKARTSAGEARGSRSEEAEHCDGLCLYNRGVCRTGDACSIQLIAGVDESSPLCLGSFAEEAHASLMALTHVYTGTSTAEISVLAEISFVRARGRQAS